MKPHFAFCFRFCLLVMFVVASCRGRKEGSAGNPETPTAAFKNTRDAFFASLHDPASTTLALRALPAGFDRTLLSDPQNLANYANNPVKAATNLGIYLADLNYCVAFEQPENTQQLFFAIHELSRVIGTEQKVLDYLLTRYKSNLEHNDSVKSVLDTLYQTTTTHLRGTERERYAAFIMAGYQIENLHLLLSISKSIPHERQSGDVESQFFLTLTAQRDALKIMYAFLKSMADPLDPDKNPNYLFYTNAFEELIPVFDALQPGGDQAQLYQKVEAIRKKVIEL